MDKIGIVATTEFGTAVRTKAFLIGVILMPLIMGGSILIQGFVAKQVDAKPRPFAVIDETAGLYPTLARKAAEHNAAVAGSVGRNARGPRFEPRLVPPAGRPLDEVRLDLSERIRRGELFAFVELPAGLLATDNDGPRAIRYYSDQPGYDDLRRWIEATLNDEIRKRRYRAAGIDLDLVSRLDRPVGSEPLGLLARGKDGKLRAAEKIDPVRSLAVPAVLSMLLFVIVMSTAPQLLNSVLEEKMSRISEVLLGSVTPFELMLGKLLGNTAVSLVLATLYVGGAYAVARHFGYADAVSLAQFAAFGFFLIIAVFLFGSLYMAVGSACSEIKDAQSLMMPVVLLTMLPIFFWTAVLKSPSSPLSVGLSLFPPATPFLMLLRMSLHPAPPAWHVILSAVLSGASAVAAAFAAAKVFRTGLLMQGKPPSFRELARWVFAR